MKLLMSGKESVNCVDTKFNQAFWEEALYKENHMIVNAKVVHSSDVAEINTYEQLREIDRFLPA